MLLTIVEFAFVALGVKFLLGIYVIYMLLPADNVCAACDGETVRVQSPRGFRRIAALMGVHERWCLSCGTSVLARRQETTSPVPASSSAQLAGR
jgi:hypothetical protein